MQLINDQYLNKTSFLYFHLKFNFKLSRLKTLQVGSSFFIKYCDALIMSSSIQLLQDSKMSLCHFVSTIPQQLSQTLLCEEDVEPASILSQSMSTSCVVAFSLLVQVCPGWQSDVQDKPAVLHLHVLLL